MGMTDRMVLATVMQALILAFASPLSAATPTCYTTHGGYCAYEGKVRMIHANSGGLILMYFDAQVPVEAAQASGYTVINPEAGAIMISDNPEFARMFYSTALAAQSSKRNVTVQLRGAISGYMKIDRIWLSE